MKRGPDKMDPQRFIINDEKPPITFVTRDDKTFVVSPQVVQQSTVIARDLEGDVSEGIPLPSVDSNHFDKILYWCMHHIVNVPAKTEDKKGEHYPVTSEFDKAFFNELVGPDKNSSDQVRILKDFMIPVNYLDIKPLLLQCAWYLTHTFIKGKTPDQLRETFQPKVLSKAEQELLAAHPEWDQ